MEKETAKKIMSSLEVLGEVLNELAADIEKIKDIQEKALKKMSENIPDDIA
jgi:hypothetical protein